MSNQNFYIQDEGTRVTLSLYGRLEVTSVAEVNRASDEILAEVPGRWNVVVIDLQSLDLIDSSGVSSIVGLFKRGRQAGAHVYVTGARGQPLEVLRILRMDKIFGM